MEDGGTETGQLEIPLQKRADTMTEIPPSNQPANQNTSIFRGKMSIIVLLDFLFFTFKIYKYIKLIIQF